jgi:hypothetical protein
MDVGVFGRSANAYEWRRRKRTLDTLRVGAQKRV